MSRTRPSGLGGRPVRRPRVAGSRRGRPDGDQPVEPPGARTVIESDDRADGLAGTPAPERRRPRPVPSPYPSGQGKASQNEVSESKTSQGKTSQGKASQTRSASPAAGRLPRAAKLWWSAAALAVVVVAVAVLTVISYGHYRAGSIRQDAWNTVLGTAKQSAARYVSYDYRRIQPDRDAAARVMTGEFRDQYRQSMDQTIIPVAVKVKAVVRGETVSAGVSSVNDAGTEAVVIAFVNEKVTNTNLKGPRVDLVRLRLTMTRVGPSWLISWVESV